MMLMVVDDARVCVPPPPLVGGGPRPSLRPTHHAPPGSHPPGSHPTRSPFRPAAIHAPRLRVVSLPHGRTVYLLTWTTLSVVRTISSMSTYHGQGTKIPESRHVPH